MLIVGIGTLVFSALPGFLSLCVKQHSQLLFLIHIYSLLVLFFILLLGSITIISYYTILPAYLFQSDEQLMSKFSDFTAADLLDLGNIVIKAQSLSLAVGIILLIFSLFVLGVFVFFLITFSQSTAGPVCSIFQLILSSLLLSFPRHSQVSKMCLLSAWSSSHLSLDSAYMGQSIPGFL